MGKKKVEMREEDVCSLLQRYQASTILTLLREISHHPDVHLNWDSLFHKTTTSSATASASAAASASCIKSPRELQLLWRHLAYRRPLDDVNNNNHNHEDDVDSDSDLDVELEAVPTPTNEVALEVAACVKLLASPDSTNPTNISNTNVNTKTNADTNVVGVVAEVAKKRKWCAEEDNELRKAVDKWGEGNWSAISKHGQWSASRTPAQLSQRWSHIRKKKPPFSIAHSSTASCSSSSTTPHLSESQLATRRAIDLALKDSLAPLPSAAAAVVAPATKLKPKTTPTTTVSDTIQRTAVAAGARILDPSHPQADALLNCSNVHFFRSNP